MESMINTLYLRLKGEPLTETPDHHLKNFLLIERDDDGSVLHGFVKQISPSDYHIFVREKDMILGYEKNIFGTVTCTFGSQGHETWVQRFAKKLENR
jgi:hypothetical protein